MKLARIATAALISAAFTAGCTEQPTSVQRSPGSHPVFEGGGYMGNGGFVPSADTTRNDPATTNSTSTTTGAAPGGGYAGNGG